ncbi:MAG: hypothetical protein ACT4OE_03915 [Sphingosinicella sp.]
MMIMDIEKSVFDSPDAEAEAQADARAETDIAAGRVVSDGAVRKWLRSWGRGKPIPRPQAGD